MMLIIHFIWYDYFFYIVLYFLGQLNITKAPCRDFPSVPREMQRSCVQCCRIKVQRISLSLCCVSATVFLSAFLRSKHRRSSGNYTSCWNSFSPHFSFFFFFLTFVSRDSKWVALFLTFHTERTWVENFCLFTLLPCVHRPTWRLKCTIIHSGV